MSIWNPLLLNCVKARPIHSKAKRNSLPQGRNATAYLDEEDMFLLKKDGADGDPKAIEADPAASDSGPLRPGSSAGKTSVFCNTTLISPGLA